MTHVIHACPNMDGLKWGVTMGWPTSAIPLNADRHEKCPYCGAETKNMEKASGSMVDLLNAGPRGTRNMKGAIASPESIREIIREELARNAKGGSQ